MKRKTILKIIAWLAGISFFVFLAANIIFIIFGKAIVVSQIEQNLKLKANLERISFSLPLSVSISKLEVGNLFKADSISLSPSLLGFLAGKIILNELKIIKPEITLIKDAEGNFNLPVLEAKGKQPPFLLAGLKVRAGKVIFTDKKLSPEGYKVNVDSIHIDIAKIAFPPTSLYTNFNLSAVLRSADNSPGGSLNASGWIDFGPKNMDGRVELSELDIAALAPYFQNMFPVKKMLSAKLNLTADLKAKNNDLTIKCHGEILKQTKKSEGQSDKPELFSDIVNFLSDTEGKITFDFPIHTKLDNPRFDMLNLKGIIAQTVVENIVTQPPENVVDKVKGAVGEIEELGKSLKKIFKKE
mgnify:CR=1 FL=1